VLPLPGHSRLSTSPTSPHSAHTWFQIAFEQADRSSCNAGLSVYSLAPEARQTNDSSLGIWGQDEREGVQVAKTARGHSLIIGGWRDREREREREAAKDAQRQARQMDMHARQGSGGGERASGEGPGEDVKTVKRRELGQARWASVPSKGGSALGSAALLVGQIAHSVISALRTILFCCTLWLALIAHFTQDEYFTQALKPSPKKSAREAKESELSRERKHQARS
jgi:hypothetical protein